MIKFVLLVLKRKIKIFYCQEIYRIIVNAINILLKYNRKDLSIVLNVPNFAKIVNLINNRIK
jgi:hypothetical protein